MRQPEFWYRPQGLLSRFLSPLGALYSAAVRRRLKAGPRIRAEIPVICIGNLNVGGSGKTPAAMALAERLLELGHRPHFLSRGYGGFEKGPLRVDPSRHDSAAVGDEPLLLAACAPAWVARDRAAAAAEAAAAGATAAILDDGHQNSSLVHDFSIVVADARRGFGNGMVLPAGPLREPVKSGLARADLLLLVGGDPARTRFLEYWRESVPAPIAFAGVRPVKTGIRWKGMRVVAFAGIADPEKFFHILRELGADIAQQIPLSDHAPLSERLLRRLAAAAASEDAALVTTEKDAARLPGGWRTRILSLPVRLHIENWGEIEVILNRIMSRGQPSRPGHSPSASSSSSASRS